MRNSGVIVLALFAALAAGCASGGRAQPGADPLPSWNDGPTKQALLGFAADAPEGAVAVFDHDGALIAEQPVYLQYAFVIDTLAARAPRLPEWQNDPLLVAALAGDYRTVLSTRDALGRLTSAAGLDGVTAEEYGARVRAWLDTARHPTLDRPWRDCVYQPMLELLRHLENQGVATFIVTGAGADFVRAIAEPLYGLPPWRVVGDPDPVLVEERDGVPVVVRAPSGAARAYPGKPALMHAHIGVRPSLAFGAGDGDIPMLRSVSGGTSRAFLLHHTDQDREFAYDRASPIGRLDRALDDAARHGWIVIDMARDWRVVWRDGR